MPQYKWTATWNYIYSPFKCSQTNTECSYASKCNVFHSRFHCVHLSTLYTTNQQTGGVFFDLHISAILHFWPTPNSPYYTSDLLARGITAAIWTCGRSARPRSLSYAALGPLACPSRSARPRNCLNLT